MIDRHDLPFQFPEIPVPASGTKVMRVKVARFSIPLSAPRTTAELACLVPAAGNQGLQLRDAVAKASEQGWERFARAATEHGVQRAGAVDRSVESLLLDSTLKSKRTSAPVTLVKPLWGDPQLMPTITVTAYGNVVVISISSVMRMFGSLGETPIVDWDVEVAQQQWQEDCTAWNFQMDDWEATRQAVADAAEEAANELEALADEIEAGIIQSGLETAEASCKEVAGKPMCFDFFIMNCALGPIQGDCRDFDKNADFSSSRVQLYLNPSTMQWEVKYNCSAFRVKVPVTGQVVSTTVCDSASVFDPANDVKETLPDVNGWRSVKMTFRNNACIRLLDFLCPAIDATVKFRPNSSIPGGWELGYDRDGFPAMAAYHRNASNTDWDIIVEDPQKTRSGVGAIRALAGQIRSKGYNYPPPADPPSGCYRY